MDELLKRVYTDTSAKPYRDKARKMTDKELARMERHIKRQYKQATSEITEKWNAYMERAQKRLEKHENALSDALASGDDKLIAEAEETLKNAKRSITFQDAKYRAMVEDTTVRMANANQIAIDYCNEKVPNIYAMNYNQSKYVAQMGGFAFNLVNEDVAKRLLRESVPPKRLSVPKDVRWNKKQINSAVLQGILQGEDMKKISKRILPIVDNNQAAAMRTARTMVTQAENMGRLDSYRRLEESGAILRKYWIATGDRRTREWHLVMDGQERNIDEPFEDGHGNLLDCPADPNAAMETVYNCRCSMGTIVVGFRKEDGSVSLV